MAPLHSPAPSEAAPRPLRPERPRGSPLMKLFLVLLVGVGVCGGYYGYCRYKVNERGHAMAQEAQDLHQALMRLEHDIGPKDVREVALAMARKVGVLPDLASLQIRVEPMTDETMKRLPGVAQTGLGLAARIPGEKRPTWVVGFSGRFYAKHGVASAYFPLERYTWFQWVKNTTE